MKKLLVLSLSMCSLALAQTQKIGSWLMVSEKDPITDELKIMIAAPGTPKSNLAIRCIDQKLSIFFSVSKYLDDTGVTGTYRFDNQPPVAEDMGISTDGDAVFLGELSFESFLVDVKSAKKLVFRVEDFNNTPYTYTFNLSNTSAALAKLSCVSTYLKKAASTASPQGKPTTAALGTLYIPLFQIQNLAKETDYAIQVQKSGNQYILKYRGDDYKIIAGSRDAVTVNQGIEADFNLEYAPKIYDNRLWLSIDDIWRYGCKESGFSKDNKKALIYCEWPEGKDYPVDFKYF